MKLRDCVATAAYLTNQTEIYEALTAKKPEEPEEPITEEPEEPGIEEPEEPIIEAFEEPDTEDPDEPGTENPDDGTEKPDEPGTEEPEEPINDDKDFGDLEKSIQFLVRCANLVIAEIADAYLQLRDRQEIKTDCNGFVSYNEFRKNPAYIFSAKINGRNVSYKEYPDRIELGEKGNIAFEYAYVPDKLELDDEMPFRNGKPDGRIIAYGIAAEYYLINGQSDEAVVWDKRYRDGLHNAQLKRSEARVKARDWL